jgi:hypothetical protein
MRRLAIAVVSVLTLTSMVLGTPAAWADDDKLVVIAKLTDFEKKDHGKEGPSKGDEVIFEYDLFHKDHKKAGDGGGSCELTKVGRGEHDFEADCRALFDFEDGKIKTEGEVTGKDIDDGKVVLGITSGTGDFDDAEGKAVIEPLHHHHHESGHHDEHDKDGHKQGHHHLVKVTFHFK